MVSARLPFMTRLPKKRGIIQDGEDETLTAHTELLLVESRKNVRSGAFVHLIHRDI